MSATVTGAFVILDRASSPMRKMEDQAKRTDRAITQLGQRMDHVTGRSHSEGLNRSSGEMRNLERESRTAASGMGSLDRQMRQNERSTQSFGARLREAGTNLRAFSALARPAMFAAIGVAIGAALQAVRALGGGFVSLLPRVADLAGALGALPGIVGAIVQGFATAKLAFAGVGAALKAGVAVQTQSAQQIQQNADAITAAHDRVRMASQAVQQSLVQQTVAQQQLSNSLYEVSVAQQQLKNSVVSEMVAQQQLTIARRDATRELIDLRLASTRADLSQRRAAIGLQEARFQLQQTLMSPTATMLDVRSARLGVAEAQQSVREQRVATSRAHTDAARAQRRGVSGNLQVQAAERGITAALQGHQAALHGVLMAEQGHQAALRGVAQAAQQQKNAVIDLARAQHALGEQLRWGSQAQSAFAAAMAKLSPPAQAFVRYLLSLRTQFRQLTATAAGGLFPGLTRGIRSAMGNFGVLNRIVGETARAMGHSSAVFGRFMGSGFFGATFARIGRTNANIWGRMGGVMVHLASALMRVMDASRPFMLWLTRAVERGAKFVDTWTRLHPEALANIFTRAEHSLALFGRILWNLLTVFHNVSKASRSLGNDLWQSADVATKRWARFTGSFSGQNKLRHWFAQIRTPVHELLGLFGDLAKAILNMGMGGFTATVRALRGAVAPVARLFAQLAGQFGPQLAKMIGNLARLFANLSAGGGGLTLVLKLLNRFLEIVNFLLEKIPGLSNVLSILFAGVIIRKGLSALSSLAAGWLGVGAAAEKATVAQTAASEAGALAGGRGGVGGWLTGGPLGRIGGGRVGRFLGSRGIAGNIGKVGRFAERGLLRLPGGARVAGLAAGLGARGGIGAIAKGALGRGLGVGLPLALAGGVIGNMVGGRAGGAISGAATGAGIGAMAGPLGALAGGAMGALIGGLTSGESALHKFERTAGSTFDKLKKEGNVGALNKLARQADHFAKGAGKNAGALRDLAAKARAASSAEMERRLNATWGNGFQQHLNNTHNAVVALRNTMRDGFNAIAKNMGRSSAQGAVALRSNFRKGIAGARDALKAGIISHKDFVRSVRGMVATTRGQFGARWRAIWKEFKDHPKNAQRDASANLDQYIGTLRDAMAAGIISMKEFSREFDKALVQRLKATHNWSLHDTLSQHIGVRGTGTGIGSGHGKRRGGLIERLQHGGPVGGMGDGDHVPALLEPGEFVMRRHAVRQHGLHAMKQINRGEINPHLKLSHREGNQELRRTMSDWNDITQRGHRALRATQDTTEKRQFKSWRRIHKEISTDTRAIQVSTTKDWHQQQKDVDAYNELIRRGNDRDWTAVKKSITDSVSAAQRNVSLGYGKMRTDASRELRTLGYKPTEITQFLKGKNPNPSGQPTKKARGGRIEGVGLADTVPVAPGNLAAPGELIVNRHTESRLDRLLGMFGTSLGGEVAGETRPHSHALGGRVPGHPELKGGISAAVNAVLSHFPGLTITSTTGGHHAGGSKHYTGEAADVASSSIPYMDRAAAWIGPAMGGGLYEGIHNPNLSIKSGKNVSPGLWGAATWAAHINHIHLSVLGAILRASGISGGVGGGASINVPRSQLRGVPGGLAQGYLNAIGAGFNQRLGGAGGGAVGGMVGNIMQLAQRAAGIAGLAFDPRIISTLLQKESSGGQNLGPTGPLSATGPFQVIPSTFKSYMLPGHGNISNPFDNAIAAMRYIKSRYGSLAAMAGATGLFGGGYHGYKTGGRVPEFGGWFAQGGEFTAHRPTILGVGERGPERVSVRPLGDGGGRGVHIEAIHINNHRPGDIRRQVERELEQAFNGLAGALDGQPMVGVDS